MTPRVPLVCTPEDLYRAMADVAKVVNGPPIFGGPALIPESVLALFRPAEEPEPTPVRCGRCGGTVHEWTNGIGGRGASCTSCGFGWGCATPAAPAAPPPAGEPEENDPAIASALMHMDEFVLVKRDALARVSRAARALRAENERLTGAIRWALGEGDSDFGDQLPPGRHPGDGQKPRIPPYWWRTHLRQKAGLVPPGENRSEG